jgi:hypothetical protein
MNGGFIARFDVPAGVPAGSHIVVATDEAGKIGTATFTIPGAASITLSPTSGPVGTVVTITGNGFPVNTSVTVKLDGATIATNPASITTSSTGTFTASITIPSVATGSRTIAVTVGSTNASSAFTLTQPQQTPTSEKINVSQLKLVDQTGTSLSGPSVGMQILVQSSVKNTLSTDQQFAYIVQIKDSQGATIMISWMTGTLPAGKEYAVAQSWLVENSGAYTAEVFIWQSVSNPVILAPMQKINFSAQ